MKKILLICVSILLLAGSVLAQERGSLTNIFASWYTVTTTTNVVDLPYDSRDITIHNTDSNNSICVDLFGAATIPVNCFTNDPNRPSTFVLGVNTALSLTDFMTNAVSFKTLSPSAGTTASPVSVVVTY